MNKGIGLVASVPNYVADDYMALKTLHDKRDFAVKHDITFDMFDDFKIALCYQDEDANASIVFIGRHVWKA